jgi:glutamate-1-semialdehyde 2,1-aminomutase
MSLVAPCGPVYQAGTLSGNPVAMAAGLAQLKLLKETPDFYSRLNERADRFFTALAAVFDKAGAAHCLNHVASLGCVFFCPGPVRDYAGAKASDTDLYAGYFRRMLEAGVYLAPSQFEAMFISAAHTEAELEETLEAAGKACAC